MKAYLPRHIIYRSGGQNSAIILLFYFCTNLVIIIIGFILKKISIELSTFVTLMGNFHSRCQKISWTQFHKIVLSDINQTLNNLKRFFSKIIFFANFFIHFFLVRFKLCSLSQRKMLLFCVKLYFYSILVAVIIEDLMTHTHTAKSRAISERSRSSCHALLYCMVTWTLFQLRHTAAIASKFSNWPLI